jgi:hypothetical protein
MASPFALKVRKIEGRSGQKFGFPKHLIHIACTKGLVSFGLVRMALRNHSSSMSSGAGRKSRLFFWKKVGSAWDAAGQRIQYSSSLKKKSSFEG